MINTVTRMGGLQVYAGSVCRGLYFKQNSAYPFPGNLGPHLIEFSIMRPIFLQAVMDQYMLNNSGVVNDTKVYWKQCFQKIVVINRSNEDVFLEMVDIRPRQRILQVDYPTLDSLLTADTVVGGVQYDIEDYLSPLLVSNTAQRLLKFTRHKFMKLRAGATLLFYHGVKFSSPRLMSRSVDMDSDTRYNKNTRIKLFKLHPPPVRALDTNGAPTTQSYVESSYSVEFHHMSYDSFYVQGQNNPSAVWVRGYSNGGTGTVYPRVYSDVIPQVHSVN